jgi:hypothetical protein
MKSMNIYLLTSFAAILVIDIAAVDGGSAVNAFNTANDYQNLQVLPKDISTRDLQHIMVDEFQDGLGVGCGYCHATKKGTILLDYASDEKPEKEIARRMMKMTLEVNRNHFGVEEPKLGDMNLPVTCATCHRGSAHPEL